MSDAYAAAGVAGVHDAVVLDVLEDRLRPDVAARDVGHGLEAATVERGRRRAGDF